MKAQFRSAVLFVKDMAASRHFYEQLLGQQVEMDLGANVGYVGGLALWEVQMAYSMVFQHAPERDPGRDSLELYFEIDDLDAAQETLLAAGVKLLHPIIEQPWAQRALRACDPDGFAVEIAEPMPVVVKRLAASGLNAEAIQARTFMPLPAVEQMLAAV